MTTKPSIVQVESTDGKFFSRLIDWLNNADVERDSTLIRVLDGEQPDPELTRLQSENAHLQKQYDSHLMGCAVERESLLSIGIVDTSDEEQAIVWRNVRAEEAEAENARLREACRAALAEIEALHKDAMGAAEIVESVHSYINKLERVEAIETCLNVAKRHLTPESEAHDEATQSE